MLYLFICLIFSVGIRAGEWWTLPRTEDSLFIYYVGVADGRKEKFSQLQELATNKAMSEIIREHFGMSVQITETAVEELGHDSFQIVSKHSSAPLFIKGTSLVKTFEKSVGDTTRVYVLIRAEKQKILESVEKHRLGFKEEQLNTYGDSHASMVNFKVKTNPTGALINLSHLDQRYAIQGQGDAIFNIPRGRYKMVITSPGHLAETRELLIQSSGREEFITLEKLHSLLELSIVPEDAEVKINGVKTDEKEFHLTVGKVFNLSFSHPDYLSQSVEVISHLPENMARSIELEPKKSTLFLDIWPKEAEIQINNRPVSTYQGKIQVGPGTLNLTVSHPGFDHYSERIVVRPNREYPLKVIRLQKSKNRALPTPTQPRDLNRFAMTSSPSDEGVSLRAEYNPVSSMGNLGRFHLLPVGLHIEWAYISLGAGVKYTSKEEERKDTNTKGQKEVKTYFDLYTTVRLISPRIGNLKLFASGTLGEVTQSFKTFDQAEPVTKTKSYRGIGGGIRYYMSPKWSVHGEYFNLQSTEKEKNIKLNEGRLILGVGYEF